MKKFLVFAALLLSAFGAIAQEIRSIDIDVYIDDEGDAYIEQRWDVTVVRGTEWYIPIGNLNGMSIRGLTVSENGEEFIDEGFSWDTDRTLAQKAGRSGIIRKSDGVELCWGQGSMGDHKWTAGFVALGLVNSLEDYDAFNFMFINPDLIAPPQHASICFHRLSDEPFSFDYTRFWVFGCEGESELREDGTIFFETDRPMPRNGSLIVMMRFDKGIFNCSNVRKMKFEKMQKQAFKGSTYKDKKTSKYSFEDIVSMIVAGAFILVIVGLVLLFIFFVIRDIVLRITGRLWKKSVFGSVKPKGWAREAPFKGSIPVAVWLMTDGSRLMLSSQHPERRIGAYFLKWISEGLVRPVKAPDGHYDLEFPKELPDFADTCETTLFRKAMEAAGSNNILENGEFKSWATDHYKSMVNWPKTVEKEGKAQFAKYSAASNADNAAQLIQFKNFLSDFSLSKEREAPEVSLWGQYLVFAQLFGIADKVAKGFAKLYPDQFTEYSEKYGVDPVAMRSIVHSWTSITSRAYDAAYSEKISRESSSSSGSSGGFGGHSSFGGGGGFSGGGHGGGSR